MAWSLMKFLISIGNYVRFLCLKGVNVPHPKRAKHLRGENSGRTTSYGFPIFFTVVLAQSSDCRRYRNLLTLRSDSRSAASCFTEERLGDTRIGHIFWSCCGPRSARCPLQCRTCWSEIWHPTINQLFIGNSMTFMAPFYRHQSQRITSRK